MFLREKFKKLTLTLTFVAKKKYHHNKEFFPKQNVPHGVIILAIIVRLGEEDVSTKDILRVWEGIVRMRDVYNNLKRYLYNLRKGGYIKTNRKKNGSYHTITTHGWRRLVYHYKKGNIPKRLLEYVEERYKQYDEYFRWIKEERKKLEAMLLGKRYKPY